MNREQNSSHIVDVTELGREVPPMRVITKYHCPTDGTELQGGHVGTWRCVNCHSSWDGRYPNDPGWTYNTVIS